jgi:hypothetical protein
MEDNWHEPKHQRSSLNQVALRLLHQGDPEGSVLGQVPYSLQLLLWGLETGVPLEEKADKVRDELLEFAWRLASAKPEAVDRLLSPDPELEVNPDETAEVLEDLNDPKEAASYLADLLFHNSRVWEQSTAD